MTGWIWICQTLGSGSPGLATLSHICVVSIYTYRIIVPHSLPKTIQSYNIVSILLFSWLIERRLLSADRIAERELEFIKGKPAQFEFGGVQ